jgi:hypothetical protein
VVDAFSESKPLEVITFTGTAEQRGAATVAQASELVRMGVQKMQLLMMSRIFLGGLKDEIRVRVLESGTENVKTALKLAREVEVILGDAAKRPKGVTVATLQELGEDEEESLMVIKALNAIKTNKRGTGNPGYRGNTPRGNDPRTLEYPSGGFTLICYYCSNSGHMAKDCRKKARDLSNNSASNGNGNYRNPRPPTVKSIHETSEQEGGGGQDPGGHFYTPQINTIRWLYAGFEQDHLN